MTESVSRSRRGGRPRFVATEEQRAVVYELAKVGIPQGVICRVIRHPNGRYVCAATLVKHFRYELTLGSVEATVAVAGALYEAGMAGSVVAQIFWLKTRAGWRGRP